MHATLFFLTSLYSCNGINKETLEGFSTNLTRVHVLKRPWSHHCWRAMVVAVFAQFLWWEL